MIYSPFKTYRISSLSELFGDPDTPYLYILLKREAKIKLNKMELFTCVPRKREKVDGYYFLKILLRHLGDP